MTVRQKAVKMIHDRACTFELTYSKWDARELHYIEVLAPEDYLFDGESTSLTCKNWQEVLDRLPEYELLAENNYEA